jgi:hydrogenase expression/formation protein HypE
VGERFADPAPSATAARPGDRVIVSGTLGDHGICILVAREELSLGGSRADGPGGVLESDCASLLPLVEAMIDAGGPAVRTLRDMTRGGMSAALNEIAMSSQISIEIEEGEVPVRREVQGACELLGMSPFEIANEGKLLAVVAPEAAEDVLAAMRAQELGGNAAIVGTVGGGRAGRASARTPLGTSRLIDLPAGELLPRIC